jgi:uncharacterized protein (DUF1499 family)
MNDLSVPRPWGVRLARLAFFGGIGSAIIAALGAYGSGWGFWDFRIGFAFLGFGLLLAVAAVIGGILSFFLDRRSMGPMGTVIGIVAASGLLFVMGSTISKGRQFPMIHDVTTDLRNPPAFQALALREDNLVGLEGGVAEWQAIHAKAYSDIQPLRLPMTQADAMARARKIVNARGWLVTLSNDSRIEATDTLSPFKFKDDIVIVATPESGGAVTRIDVRSVSRVGIGDLGANAKRVRGLLTDLRAGV